MMSDMASISMGRLMGPEMLNGFVVIVGIYGSEESNAWKCGFAMTSFLTSRPCWVA
jgi:hypothetical protein